MKHGRRYRKALESVDRAQEYSLKEAITLVMENATAKFDETVEVAVNLGVDPRHADQNVRVTTSLPFGIGREIKILVLAKGPHEKEAHEAGADYVGAEDFIKKLREGWDEVDVIIATPEMMPQVGQLGRILGPKGLMPNPKSGTVTPQVGKAVKEIKAGRVELRVDRQGTIHTAVGKSSFDKDQLSENIKSVVSTLLKAKPPSIKGTYFKKLTISSTMGPGIKVDRTTVI